MQYWSSLGLAIFFTSAAYLLADLTLFQQLTWWQPFIIGTTVVVVGAFVEKIGAPMWLIIVLPLPIGLLSLLYFLNGHMLQWLLTYPVTLIYYLFLHVLLSTFIRFDSLIPAWKLHISK